MKIRLGIKSGVKTSLGVSEQASSPTPYAGPIDSLNGVRAAYSVRLLKSSYTGNCLRLRRSSDNAESDFAFSSNFLDVAAIGLWLGTSNGFVKTWYDQSGNGNDATQTGSNNQPRYISSLPAFGDHPVVMMTGSAGFWTPSMNLSTKNAVSLISYLTLDDSPSTRILGEFSTDFNGVNDGFAIFSNSNSSMTSSLQGNSNYSTFTTTGSFLNTVPLTFSSVMDKSLATNEPIIYLSGTSNGSWTANANNTNNYGTYRLYIGNRNNGSLQWRGDFTEYLLLDAAIGTSDRQSIESSMKTAFPDNTLRLSDNMRLTKTTRENYVYRFTPSPFARGVWLTNSTSVDVEVWNNGTTSPYNRLGVRVNGSDFSNPTIPGGNGIRTITVSLGSNVSSVELVCNGNGSGGITGADMQILSVNFNDSATRVDSPTTPRICIYGDSISSGVGTTNPVFDSWPILVRRAYSGSVITEAYSGRTLNADCSTTATRITFSARFAAVTPTVIWLAIGTNDYGVGGVWNASDFGTAYADFLDKLHAAVPGATIYAQTPIHRTTETANGFGNTLDDYRSQISTAQSTRSSFCTLVDGTGASFPQTGDLSDGLHPTTAGNVKYANAVKAVLGI